MSKLVNFLAAACAVLSIWLAVMYHFVEFKILNEYRFIVTVFPVIIIGVLLIYAAVTVLWRVYSFNDCDKEAFELQAEIKEARADLIAKGFVFQ